MVGDGCAVRMLLLIIQFPTFLAFLIIAIICTRNYNYRNAFVASPFAPWCRERPDFFCRMGYRYVSHRSAHIFCRRVLQCLDCKSRAVHNACFCNLDRLRSISLFREATLVAKYTCKLAAPARISRSSLRKKRSLQSHSKAPQLQKDAPPGSNAGLYDAMMQ